MDLKNVTGDLRTGKRVEPEGSEKVIILTPLCRASFMDIATAKSFRGGKPRFGMSMIFERSVTEIAAVDVMAVLVPGILEAAKREGLKVAQDERGLKFGDKETRVINLGARHNQETGEAFDGYNPTSLWISAYKLEDSSRDKKVQCYDAANNPCDASMIKAGDWVRCIIGPYKPQSWSMLSIGLIGVQLVMPGPAFGGEDPSVVAFEAIPGAPVIAKAVGAVDFSVLGV
jgi:hypothetical protein